VQCLLKASLFGDGADLVVFIGRPFDLVDAGDAIHHSAAQVGRAHLRHPDLLRPFDLLGVIVPERIHLEVCADALHPIVVEDLSGLLSVSEVLVLVIRRVAQLDDLDAQRLHILQQAREIVVDDPLPMRIGLAADRQIQRIRVQLQSAGSKEPGDCRARSGLLEELTSRDHSHRRLLAADG